MSGKIKNRLIYSLSTIILLFFFIACNPDVVFEKNKSIDSDGWYYRDVVTFPHNFSDTTIIHDIYLNVRNNNEYPYSNFIVFFETEFPDGRIFAIP